MIFNKQPILEDALLLLRPLQESDSEALFAVASDPLIWELHPAKERATPEGFALYFKEAIASQSAFAVIDKQTGLIIGTSRYHKVPETDDAIEIGWTFLSRAYWGGTYNQAMKKLMMDYAFRFVTHILFFVNSKNWRSRRAVEKIGGVLITELAGQVLDTRGDTNVVYAIRRK